MRYANHHDFYRDGDGVGIDVRTSVGLGVGVRTSVGLQMGDQVDLPQAAVGRAAVTKRWTRLWALPPTAT